ncbi:MAG: hypothetical protein KIG35_02295 [Prevotellamassilia sp.]|nr:hypothetical protein [Prevotellamassilia sp.]
MRKFRFLLATLLLVAIPLGVNAQEKFIKTDFKVRKNISFYLCPDDKENPGLQLNPNKSYAEFQVFDFGEEGTTIILKYRFESQACDENGKPKILEGTCSWSSKWLMLGYSNKIPGGNTEEGYLITYGNQPCGRNSLIKTKNNGWALMLTASPEGSNYMTDNIIGLSVDALRTKLIKDKEPGRLSGGRKKGEYMVYDLLSIGTRKRYKSNGDYYYEANVDTPYVRFYFKNGKLEKFVCLKS